VDDACRPPRIYVHTWTPGEAVVWDNRCLLHQARPWDMRVPRVMYHARIAGDPATEGVEPAAGPTLTQAPPGLTRRRRGGR
jgi:alpha-ketoglutarate-dependent taurine dioxygenase